MRRQAVVGLLLICGLACDSSSPVAPAGSILTISANPLEIESDGSSQITVLARKSTGFPVNEGTVIILSTTLGSVAPQSVTTNVDGVAHAILSGDATMGTARVTASGGGAADASVDVSIGAEDDF